jgi:hypothetical protein
LIENNLGTGKSTGESTDPSTPVRIFTFLEQYILILSLSPNTLLPFVLLPVTYIDTATIHTTGEQGRICFWFCGPALGFTLSGYCISRAIYSNSVSLPKCLIIICAIACDLSRDPKQSQDRRTGMHMLPVVWTGFGSHPVQIFTVPEQYILILYISHNVLLSFCAIACDLY